MPVLAMLTVGSCQKVKPFPEDVLPVETEKEYVTDWQEGYMDIHQISTGRGNAAYIIMPDGTTMLVDCGDLGEDDFSQEIMKQKPNSSKSPAEWVAQYIKHFATPLGNDGKIDYAIMTHFHADHIGQFDQTATSSATKPYLLHGITHLNELLEIDELVDRAYPTYDIPSASAISAANSGFANYKSYVLQRDSDGKKNARFICGTDSQFQLLHDKESYPTFSIRNLAVNKTCWSGSGSSVIDWPTTKTDENEYSCAIKITYGKFGYYTGGDLYESTYETKIAALAGQCEVAVVNHHGNGSPSEGFARAMTPSVYIIPVWDYYHPQPANLANMLSTTYYPDDRKIFAAGLVESNRVRLGSDGEKIEKAGHIMVRVYAGGDTYQVFVLNDDSEEYEIIYKTDILNCK